MLIVRKNFYNNYDIVKGDVIIASVINEDVANRLADHMLTWPENQIPKQIRRWGLNFDYRVTTPKGILIYVHQSDLEKIKLEIPKERINDYRTT